MENLECIGDINITTIVPASSRGQVVQIRRLWQERTIVLVFLRRFGCKVCRYCAIQISKLKQDLDAAGVGLVGIGFGNDVDDANDVDDFVRGEFFQGDLYVDVNRQAYKELKIQRKGFMSGYGLFDPRFHAVAIRAANVPGNFVGDGFQLGATFIIERGGRILHEHRQAFYGDEMDLNQIRSVLGIEQAPQCSPS